MMSIHQLGKAILLCGFVWFVEDAGENRGARMNEIIFCPCVRMYWHWSSGIRSRVLERDKMRGS
ncbi:hypothetical protein RSAG8_01021, partial [Rhizoctonia solani AG-8 WAC10335]